MEKLIRRFCVILTIISPISALICFLASLSALVRDDYTLWLVYLMAVIINGCIGLICFKIANYLRGD